MLDVGSSGRGRSPPPGAPATPSRPAARGPAAPGLAHRLARNSRRLGALRDSRPGQRRQLGDAGGVRRLPVLLALATLALPAAYAVWFGVRAVGYRYSLDYGEGPLLNQALRFARGQGIYAIPGKEPPWTISNYPPLYPLLESAAAWVFGPAYWYGRLISLVSALG